MKFTETDLVAGLKSAVTELCQRFGSRIQSVQVAQPNEVYVEVKMDLVAGICAQVYRRWHGRLAGLFADDARFGALASAGQGTMRNGPEASSQPEQIRSGPVERPSLEASS